MTSSPVSPLVPPNLTNSSDYGRSVQAQVLEELTKQVEGLKKRLEEEKERSSVLEGRVKDLQDIARNRIRPSRPALTPEATPSPTTPPQEQEKPTLPPAPSLPTQPSSPGGGARKASEYDKGKSKFIQLEKELNTTKNSLLTSELALEKERNSNQSLNQQIANLQQEISTQSELHKDEIKRINSQLNESHTLIENLRSASLRQDRLRQDQTLELEKNIMIEKARIADLEQELKTLREIHSQQLADLAEEAKLRRLSIQKQEASKNQRTNSGVESKELQKRIEQLEQELERRMVQSLRLRELEAELSWRTKHEVQLKELQVELEKRMNQEVRIEEMEKQLLNFSQQDTILRSRIIELESTRTGSHSKNYSIQTRSVSVNTESGPEAAILSSKVYELEAQLNEANARVDTILERERRQQRIRELEMEVELIRANREQTLEREAERTKWQIRVGDYILREGHQNGNSKPIQYTNYNDTTTKATVLVEPISPVPINIKEDNNRISPMKSPSPIVNRSPEKQKPKRVSFGPESGASIKEWTEAAQVTLNRIRN